MSFDSKNIGLTISKEMLAAVKAIPFDGSVHDFVREAISEKLWRDYGVEVSARLSRLGQGRRTDLGRTFPQGKEVCRGNA